MSFEVDWEAALRSVNGNRQLLKTVIDVFQQEAARLQAEIAEAVESGNAALLQRSGHTFKGTMVSVGAEAWSHLAARLEQLGASGTTEGAQSIAAELTSCLPVLLEQLQTFTVEQSD